jgi:hypothetical protein
LFTTLPTDINGKSIRSISNPTIGLATFGRAVGGIRRTIHESLATPNAVSLIALFFQGKGIAFRTAILGIGPTIKLLVTDWADVCMHRLLLKQSRPPCTGMGLSRAMTARQPAEYPDKAI